jgi:hypothetical protein
VAKVVIYNAVARRDGNLNVKFHTFVVVFFDSSKVRIFARLSKFFDLVSRARARLRTI